MRKKRFIYFAAASLISIFIASVTAAAESFTTVAKTVNKLDLASVSCRIAEVYDRSEPVFPGCWVEKKVMAENTGTVPVLARISLDTNWGVVDGDGVFLRDDTLDTGNFILDLNDENWVKIDHFYYYKGILNPGEVSAPLLYGFELDGTSTGGSYAKKTGNVIVNLEAIQAYFGVDAYWGISYESLGIDSAKLPKNNASSFSSIVMAGGNYVLDTGSNGDIVTEVKFYGKEDGFAFEVNNGDLFANFKGMIPGEARTQLVSVTNSWNEPAELSLWSEADMSAVSTELMEKLLSEYSKLVVTDDLGTVLYSGPIYGKEGNLSVSLGEFAPGETKLLKLSLIVSPDIGSDFSHVSTSVVWGFRANGEEVTVTPPMTGDSSDLFYFLVSAILSFLTLLSIIIKRNNES